MRLLAFAFTIIIVFVWTGPECFEIGNGSGKRCRSCASACTSRRSTTNTTSSFNVLDFISTLYNFRSIQPNFP